MKKRFFSLLLSILLVLSIIPMNVHGAEPKETEDMLSSRIQKILSWKMLEEKVANENSLIQDGFGEETYDSISSWYVIGLRGMESDYDFSAAANQIAEQLKEETLSPVEYQRLLLLSIAMGKTPDNLPEIIDKTIGQQGVMSLVYGLLVMNGADLDGITQTREMVASQLVELQNEDGSFGLGDTSGDVDVTAMVLQALSSFSKKTEIQKTIDKALEYLSKVQLPTGDFQGFFSPSSESCAQVLLALCALNISPESDPRFIKNGNTIYDGLVQYEKNDGSYTHTIEGESNALATSQVFLAYVACLRMEKQQCYLFQYSEYTSTAKVGNSFSLMKSWKKIGYCITMGLAVAYLIFLLIKKKFHWKRLVMIGIYAGIVCVLIHFVNITTPEEHYAAETVNPQAEKIRVYVEIDASIVQGKDVMIQTRDIVEVPEGSSAFDLLYQITRQNQIQLDYSGSASSGLVYIKGIQYVYEFQYGDTSGWVYLVNNVMPEVGCGEYSLKTGDYVRFVYSKNMGKDVREEVESDEN